MISDCLFVYGTLMRGFDHPMARLLSANADFRGEASCRGRLYMVKHYPGLVLSDHAGDIGVPPEPDPMDFSGWFEVYLSGQWYTFDARHNVPRIGRILMGTGRDAADVALTTSFGRMTLTKFVVVTDEVVAA